MEILERQGITLENVSNGKIMERCKLKTSCRKFKDNNNTPHAPTPVSPKSKNNQYYSNSSSSSSIEYRANPNLNLSAVETVMAHQATTEFMTNSGVNTENHQKRSNLNILRVKKDPSFINDITDGGYSFEMSKHSKLFDCQRSKQSPTIHQSKSAAMKSTSKSELNTELYTSDSTRHTPQPQQVQNSIDTNYLNYIETREENVRLKEHILSLKTYLTKQGFELQKCQELLHHFNFDQIKDDNTAIKSNFNLTNQGLRKSHPLLPPNKNETATEESGCEIGKSQSSQAIVTTTKYGDMGALYQKYVNNMKSNSLLKQHIYDPLIAKSELNQMYRTATCYLTTLNEKYSKSLDDDSLLDGGTISSDNTTTTTRVFQNGQGNDNGNRKTLIKLAAEKKFMEMELQRKQIYSLKSELDFSNLQLHECKKVNEDLSLKLGTEENKCLNYELCCQLLRQINFLLNVSLALKELQQQQSSFTKSPIGTAFKGSDDSFYESHDASRCRKNYHPTSITVTTQDSSLNYAAEENLTMFIEYLEKKTLDFATIPTGTTNNECSIIKDRISPLVNHVNYYRHRINRYEYKNESSTAVTADSSTIKAQQISQEYMRRRLQQQPSLPSQQMLNITTTSNSSSSAYCYYNSNSLGSDSSSSGISVGDPNGSTSCFSPIPNHTGKGDEKNHLFPHSQHMKNGGGKLEFYIYADGLIHFLVDLLRDRYNTVIRKMGISATWRPSNPLIRALFECFLEQPPNPPPVVYENEYERLHMVGGCQEQSTNDFAIATFNGWVDNLLVDMDYTRYTTTVAKLNQQTHGAGNSSSVTNYEEEDTSIMRKSDGMIDELRLENALTLSEMAVLKGELQFMSEDKYYAEREKGLIEFRLAIKDNIEAAVKCHLQNLESDVINFQNWALENLDPASPCCHMLRGYTMLNERIKSLLDTLENVQGFSDSRHKESMKMVADLKKINGILMDAYTNLQQSNGLRPAEAEQNSISDNETENS